MGRQRFYGIDFLRIVCMGGVVMLHTLDRGGLLGSSLPSQYLPAWFLEVTALFSVDCFAMITGFVSYSDTDKPLNLKSFISTWLEVFFYGICLTIMIRSFTGYPVEKSYVTKALFPVLHKEYWYFSAYTGVFFLSRLINNSIRHTDNRTLIKYLCLILTFFGFYETLSSHFHKSAATSNLAAGYSFAWLLILYIFGAILRKTGIYLRIRKSRLFLMIIASVFFSYIWLLWIGPRLVWGENTSRLFTRYTSPTMIIIAAGMLCLFARMDPGEKQKALSGFLAKRSFSIYLLNTHPLILKYFYNGSIRPFLSVYEGIGMICAAVIIVIIWIIAALVIDSVRIILFDLLRINALSEMTGKMIMKVSGGKE